MPETFRAVRFHRTGNPLKVLVVDDLPFRELKADEVRIHVTAFTRDRQWASLDFLGPTRRSLPHDLGPTGAIGLGLDPVA